MPRAAQPPRPRHPSASLGTGRRGGGGCARSAKRDRSEERRRAKQQPQPDGTGEFKTAAGGLGATSEAACGAASRVRHATYYSVDYRERPHYWALALVQPTPSSHYSTGATARPHECHLRAGLPSEGRGLDIPRQLARMSRPAAASYRGWRGSRTNSRIASAISGNIAWRHVQEQ